MNWIDAKLKLPNHNDIIFIYTVDHMSDNDNWNIYEAYFIRTTWNDDEFTATFRTTTSKFEVCTNDYDQVYWMEYDDFYRLMQSAIRINDEI